MPCKDDSWLIRAMLSASRSLISTNWPAWTLFTSVCGNGSQAGERIKPGLDEEARSVINMLVYCTGREALDANGRIDWNEPLTAADPVVITE